MAWLRGSTDVANIQQDIYNLLRGTMAAGSRGSGQSGNGVTVAGVDAWTGLDATNFILRSQATEKIGAERLLWRGRPRIVWGANGVVTNAAYPLEIGRPTFSGVYSGGTTKAYYFARVTTANTTAGTLAGTVVTYRVVDATTGATVTADTTVSGWTGTTDTKLLATGVSLTLTLTAGQQFVVNGTYWTRGYSTTFTQGVDYQPEAQKIVTTNTIIISNTSGGANNYTQTTDYQVVQSIDGFPLTTDISSGAYSLYSGIGEGVFSGIHWVTGGSPPSVGTNYYLVDADLYSCYARVQFNNPAFFLWTMDSWDATTARGRQTLNSTSAAFNSATSSNPTIFASCFSSAQASTTYINFWISVKRDKIVIILRGDNAFSGTQGWGTVQKYTALNVTRDKHNWFWGAVSSSMFLKTSRWYYDTPDPAGYAGFHPTAVSVSGSGSKTKWMGYNAATQSCRAILPSYVPAANPAAENNRWNLHHIYLLEWGAGKTSGGLESEGRDNFYRGYANGIYFLSSDGWSNLDELVDGGTTYLLLNGNAFLNQLPNSGFFAILEE